MPYYGVPIGVPGVEEVGFGFNRDVIAGCFERRWGLTASSAPTGSS